MLLHRSCIHDTAGTDITRGFTLIIITYAIKICYEYPKYYFISQHKPPQLMQGKIAGREGTGSYQPLSTAGKTNNYIQNKTNLL